MKQTWIGMMPTKGVPSPTTAASALAITGVRPANATTGMTAGLSAPSTGSVKMVCSAAPAQACTQHVVYTQVAADLQAGSHGRGALMNEELPATGRFGWGVVDGRKPSIAFARGTCSRRRSACAGPAPWAPSGRVADPAGSAMPHDVHIVDVTLQGPSV